jgi:hypothetical protein
MDERAFWLIVRRSLLAIVAAVDARFGTGKPDVTVTARPESAGPPQR